MPHNDIISQIIDRARTLGACNLIDNVKSLDDLVALFLSPQGREFCALHNFPDIGTWRSLSAAVGPDVLLQHNIYVDAANVTLANPGNAVFVGSTCAGVNLSGADCLQHVLALHGAQVDIAATRYAVVNIIVDRASHVHIIKDSSAIVAGAPVSNNL